MLRFRQSVLEAEKSTLLEPATKREIYRFWNNVEKVASLDKCWHWQGYTGDAGYGQTFFRGSKMRAHRVAFYLRYDRWPIPSCLHLPTCKRHCCNPKHLREGTQDENMNDRWSPHKYKARRRK